MSCYIACCPVILQPLNDLAERRITLYANYTYIPVFARELSPHQYI